MFCPISHSVIVKTDLGVFCSPCTMYAAVLVMLTAYSSIRRSGVVAAEQSQSQAPDPGDQEDVVSSLCRCASLWLLVAAAVLLYMRAASCLFRGFLELLIIRPG
jgi:hypothetical protein